MSESADDRDRTAVLELERAALDRWEHGDPSGFLEISADDVSYFDPFQPGRLENRDELAALYESLRGQVSADRAEIVAPRVQLLGDVAVLTFRFVSSSEGSGETRWNCTEVYRREPDGWRIVHTHWSLPR